MITKQTLLQDILRIGQSCNRCGHCCNYGSGSLVGKDAKNIAKFLGISGEKLKTEYLEKVEKFNTVRLRPITLKKGKPYGRCIFYTKKGCKINPVKPLECKVGNCGKYGEQLSIWFALNYFLNINDPESIRQYSIYLKTHPTISGGKLEEIIPNKEELQKILSFIKLK